VEGEFSEVHRALGQTYYCPLETFAANMRHEVLL
jgi:hypothetical protein